MTKEQIAKFILEEEWPEYLPPTKKQISDSVGCSKRIIEKHHTWLKNRHNIKIKVKEGKNRYIPPGYDWAGKMTQRQLQTRNLLKNQFLTDLKNLLPGSDSKDKLNKWKEGEISDKKINQIAVKLGKNPDDIEDTIFSVLEDSICDAEEEFEKIVEDRKNLNTENISEFELKRELLPKMHWKFKKSSKKEKLAKKWDKGNFEESKEEFAREIGLKSGSDTFQEKFESVKKECWNKVKEDMDYNF